MGRWDVKDYGVVADISCWCMFAVMTVVVSLRFYCRVAFGRNNLGLDDVITFLCLLVCLVACVFITIGTSHGLGKHIQTLDPAEAVLALKWNVATATVIIWTFSLPKFAIVATLVRIFNFGTKTTVFFWGLCASSQACIFATSVWWVHQCSPPERGWDSAVAGECAPVSIVANLGYFTSAYSTLLDIFFALYPVYFIMKLNMPRKSRMAVSVALSLTLLASAVSIYKLAIFGEVFEIASEDPTYAVPYLDILAVAQGFVLIVCASFPAMGPLFLASMSKAGTKFGAYSLSKSDHIHARNVTTCGESREGGGYDGKGDTLKISPSETMSDDEITPVSLNTW
ncbi:hypothetical protein F5Y15DRAFT_424270 [Xylariaceae sp. FL0016]|nr:hypothetical protein F5Y15DRAFT_424270 [Xylariaceae sp. FL0016]